MPVIEKHFLYSLSRDSGLDFLSRARKHRLCAFRETTENTIIPEENSPSPPRSRCAPITVGARAFRLNFREIRSVVGGGGCAIYGAVKANDSTIINNTRLASFGNACCGACFPDYIAINMSKLHDFTFAPFLFPAAEGRERGRGCSNRVGAHST